MSGGSVFGMTSDFNFEQSPYNEAALNSVENRQIANNPKSVEQVRKMDFGRFWHWISVFFLLKIDQFFSGLSIRLVARHEPLFVHSSNRLHVINYIKRYSQRWFYFSKPFWIYNPLIFLNYIVFKLYCVFEGGLFRWPRLVTLSNDIISFPRIPGQKLIIKFSKWGHVKLPPSHTISKLLLSKCKTFYKPFMSKSNK